MRLRPQLFVAATPLLTSGGLLHTPTSSSLHHPSYTAQEVIVLSSEKVYLGFIIPFSWCPQHKDQWPSHCSTASSLSLLHFLSLSFQKGSLTIPRAFWGCHCTHALVWATHKIRPSLPTWRQLDNLDFPLWRARLPTPIQWGFSPRSPRHGQWALHHHTPGLLTHSCFVFSLLLTGLPIVRK